MKQEGRQVEEWTPPKELTIVFDYYCRLNSKRLKHIVLEDFNLKAATMDLHQFMTFCKNFQITSKQQKRTDQNVLAQFLSSKNENKIVGQAQQIRKNEKNVSKQPQSKQQSMPNENEQLGDEAQLTKSKQNEFAGLDGSEKLEPELEEKAVVKPLVFLTQKKLSQIFKKHTSITAEINFQLFISIMKIIAKHMYKPNEPKSNPRQANQAQLSTSKFQSKDYLKDLLVFLHLERSDHIIQTFAKINQCHGNMEHLSLLRSPIKKIHIKNDPLGKYAKKTEEKENVQIFHSRMVLKGEKSLDKLPKLGKISKKKDLKSYLKTQPKAISNGELNLFFQSNKNQLLQLNRSLLAKSIQTQASRTSFQKQGELLSPNLCKSPKKYTQMHRQKVMCDIKNRQIANLIDSSSLYDDDIFNKYIQLNHKQPKQHIPLKQPKW